MDNIKVAGADDEAREEQEEKPDILWYHGIDERQDEIIEKARRQYYRKIGKNISRHGIVKRIIAIFYQDMDVIDATMSAKERAEAWQRLLKRDL